MCVSFLKSEYGHNFTLLHHQGSVMLGALSISTTSSTSTKHGWKHSNTVGGNKAIWLL